MPRSLIRDDNAVSVEIGYILNLAVLMIFTGGITTAFYLYADSSSREAMRAGFTDLGSQIARDITNMYLTSAHSQNNITLNITRDIPLTIGGKGYSIALKNSSMTGGDASIEIKDGSFFGYTVITDLSSIDTKDIKPGTVYSGSGRINIKMIKNNTGIRELWIY